MGHRECVPGCRRGCGAVLGGRCSTALAAALLMALAAGEARAQPGGLFREVASAAAVAGPDLSGVSDSITLRRRVVAIDFGRLTPPADTDAVAPVGAGAAPSGVLTLNLFDDVSFTGLVQSVAPTFSGGDLPHPAGGRRSARRQRGRSLPASPLGRADSPVPGGRRPPAVRARPRRAPGASLSLGRPRATALPSWRSRPPSPPAIG